MAGPERPAIAMIRAGEDVVVLGAHEIGQHVAEGPAGAALVVGPAVVILRAAAGVDLRVDGTAAAQHAGLRINSGAVVGVLEWCRFITPEQLARGHLGEAHGQMDVGVGVARAGLEQQHARIGHFAQPCRHHASGRPAAHNDVIIPGHVCPLLRDRPQHITN